MPRPKKSLVGITAGEWQQGTKFTTAINRAKQSRPDVNLAQFTAAQKVAMVDDLRVEIRYLRALEKRLVEDVMREVAR